MSEVSIIANINGKEFSATGRGPLEVADAMTKFRQFVGTEIAKATVVKKAKPRKRRARK